jgi:hypothetical protein
VSVSPAVPLPAPGNLPELWTRLIEAVGRVSAFTRSYLLNANPVSFEKNVLVISFDQEFEDYIGLVDNVRNHALLQTKLAELGHANALVKFIRAEAPAPGAISAPKPAPTKAAPPKKSAPATADTPTENAPAPAAPEKKTASVPFNKDDFKNDPLIKKALEVFKGTIVEVRA